MVRAKFKCVSNEPDPLNPKEGNYIKLEAVTSGSKENESFFKWTPNASVSLGTVNKAAAEQFVVGREYYADFMPVEVAAPEATPAAPDSAA